MATRPAYTRLSRQSADAVGCVGQAAKARRGPRPRLLCAGRDLNDAELDELYGDSLVELRRTAVVRPGCGQGRAV